MTRSIPRGENDLLQCFPPVATAEARLLILGSMPGARSLEAEQYYAHPRNLFWPIIEALFDIPATWPYEARCEALAEKGVALWDVIGRCERAGSLDSAIRNQTLQPNDFADFFARHRKIRRVFFNGGKAEEVFRRRVLPTLDSLGAELTLTRLPSTSPAYAALSFEQKLAAWRAVATALREAQG